MSTGRFLLRLFAAITSVVVIVAAIGYFLPRNFELEASIEIDRPPEDVFPKINSLPSWQFWSTFNEEKIEGLKVSYGEKVQGVGAVQQWTDARGSGKLWITASSPNESIEYDLQFGDFPIMKSQMQLTKTDSGTNLSWRSQGALPSGPFYGFFAPFFAGQLNHEYEMCLKQLKIICEQ
ncbi:MAG: SRPBCC family protein [Planctomycetota bacterium]